MVCELDKWCLAEIKSYKHLVGASILNILHFLIRFAVSNFFSTVRKSPHFLKNKIFANFPTQKFLTWCQNIGPVRLRQTKNLLRLAWGMQQTFANNSLYSFNFLSYSTFSSIWRFWYSYEISLTTVRKRVSKISKIILEKHCSSVIF